MLWLEIIPMSIVYIVDNVSMGGGDKTECGRGEGRNLGMQFAKRVKKSGGREFANFNWVICLSSAAKQVNTEAASAVLEVFSRKFNSFPLLCLNLLKY